MVVSILIGKINIHDKKSTFLKLLYDFNYHYIRILTQSTAWKKT